MLYYKTTKNVKYYCEFKLHIEMKKIINISSRKFINLFLKKVINPGKFLL